MRRREFISLLGGAAAAWPVAARAQQPGMPVIGYLGIGSLQTSAALAPFRRGLGDGGFVEGQNLIIEYRFYNNNEQIPALVAELLHRRIAAIFTLTTTGAIAAKAATSTIPIIFTVGDDPVKNGLVSSYNSPGGNATGVTVNAIRLEGKRLALLRELVPKMELIAALVNPKNASADVQLRDLPQAAHSVGRKIEILLASSDHEIDEAFKSAVQNRADALIVAGDAIFQARRHQIVALAAHYTIPTIYQRRDFVELGGLISYGTDYRDMFRQCGIYVGRVLRGEKPGDLPVVQPTKFELLINLKTAKALGLEHPADAARACRRGDRMIARRQFISLLGGAAVAWPGVARGQQAERMRFVSVLINVGAAAGRARFEAFKDGLQTFGWAEGRNLRIDTFRGAGGTATAAQRAATVRAGVSELVALGPEVIVVDALSSLAAAYQATRTIPIVFVNTVDPVAAGLVSSLARPNTNMTGFTSVEPATSGKWLELLKDVAPGLSRALILFSSATPAAWLRVPAIETAAQSSNVRTTKADVGDDADIERAIDDLAREPNGGIIVLPSPITQRRRDTIIARAGKHRGPAVYPDRLYVEAVAWPPMERTFCISPGRRLATSIVSSRVPSPATSRFSSRPSLSS